MTLPANDAFTLGFTGTHDPTRPSYSISFRATSPNLPFVSGTKSSTQYTSVSPSQKSRPTRRLMNNGHADGLSPSDTPAEDAAASGDHLRARLSSDKKVFRRESAKAIHKTTSTASIDWEIPRKTLHSSIGILTLYLYTSHGSPHLVVVVLGMALAIIIPADILRLNSPAFERIYERCVGFLMRESEKHATNGVIWYIIGVIFALAVYPLDVAVVSILILSWADTAASTIGRLWGSLTPPLPRRLPILRLPLAPRKSLAGFIAATVTGAAIAAGFWGWVAPTGNIQPIWTWNGSHAISGWAGLGLLSVVSGLVSGVAEALDLGSLDDNLTLPIISGGCLWGFFKFISYFSS